MSELTKVLAEQVRRVEETAQTEQSLRRFRLTHHLMPPTGWLNDPNGLCYYKGRYHVFFQYSPFSAFGGLKFWGHYSSSDMINWKYEGVPLLPDSIYDCHGVYSGCAVPEEDRLHLFYSGNIKMDGDYDYVNDGRQASTLHVESEDGVHFEDKEVAVFYKDYPEDFTCHIRDPKVWKRDGKYHMVLGGRKKGDKGAVLFYSSDDLKTWQFEKELTTEMAFGYMWECPDYFSIEDKEILSVSPQGLEREEFRYQNIYQSGYFILEDGKPDARLFQEWDMGFDFYAPQTFLDEKKRRILIGWMGMPDADKEYTNPTAKQEGWQHCLTVPREVTYRNGRLYQYPTEEMNSLRRTYTAISDRKKQVTVTAPFDAELSLENTKCRISLGGNVFLDYENGDVALGLAEEAGAGRKVRKAHIPSGKFHNVRILADTSAVEIFINHGETVFSTRYYPENPVSFVKVEGSGFSGRIYEMDKMSVVK